MAISSLTTLRSVSDKEPAAELRRAFLLNQYPKSLVVGVSWPGASQVAKLAIDADTEFVPLFIGDFRVSVFDALADAFDGGPAHLEY